MSDEPQIRRVPADWSTAALHAAGAESVSEAREDGELLGYDVRPPISDATYQAALEAALKASLVAYAADQRWRRETGGISFSGVSVATDDRSKLMLSGARIKAQTDPDYETTWFSPDGSETVLDAALIIAVSDAVLAHVDAVFMAFGQIKAQIGSGTITTTAAIDAAFAV